LDRCRECAITSDFERWIAFRGILTWKSNALCDRAATTPTAMPNHQPLIVDLGMSDTEYLNQLAQGHDPVKAYRNQSYQTVLTSYGIPMVTAAHIAPLMEKLDCSIAEKLLVNHALHHIWQQLTGQGSEPGVRVPEALGQGDR